MANTHSDKLHAALSGALPQGLHDAIRQLRVAGFTPYSILMAVLQYGPYLVEFVQDLIDAFTSIEAKAMKARAAQPKKATAECDPVLAEHLCGTQCALIHALFANHEACEAAGCCLHDHDHDGGAVAAKKK